jgi:pyridoxal phosphate enzyme (YggS family)
MEPKLIHQIAEIRSRMVHACERAGRNPTSVRLLLASKTVDPMRIRDAFHAGADLFGENKVQELVSKLPDLTDLPIEWHFIGQLQSNKVKQIVPHVKLIHSLDRMSLAEEIQKQAIKFNQTVNVLIEVNSSGEENKGGIAIDQTEDFIRELKKFDRIRICGLMTVPMNGTEKQVRECFRKTKSLLDRVSPLLEDQILSMGMSGDFEWAIEEGSTLIRVGSSVFGQRS